LYYGHSFRSWSGSAGWKDFRQGVDVIMKDGMDFR
jgi:hypothetical protein